MYSGKIPFLLQTNVVYEVRGHINVPVTYKELMYSWIILASFSDHVGGARKWPGGLVASFPWKFIPLCYIAYSGFKIALLFLLQLPPLLPFPLHPPALGEGGVTGQGGGGQEGRGGKKVGKEAEEVAMGPSQTDMN